MGRREKSVGKIVIVAEKPDIGTRLAATLGGCYIKGLELKPELLADQKWEGLIKKERFAKGYFTCTYGGREIIITWGFGHLAELKQAVDYDPKYKKWQEALFPFVPQTFEIKLKDGPGINKHWQLLRRLLTAADTDYIINATDADREGELIFDYIYRLSGSSKPFKRLWVSSYTEEGIINGFKQLKSAGEMQPLIAAARCRAIADWLVGSNLTVLATLKFGGFKNLISVGRVQTPTLAILVNRELEIRNFQAETYYQLLADFKTDKGESFQGEWQSGKKDRFKDKLEALAVLAKVQGKPGAITKQEEKSSKELPPLLYDLTALQGDCNAKFGFSAKKTLDIAQNLYEKQLITYPRTNSRYLTIDLKQEIPRLIRALPPAYNPFRDELLARPLASSKRIFDNSRVESHTAILPTYKTALRLVPEEQKVYDLIARSLLKAFLPAATWAGTKIETAVLEEKFVSSGRALVEAGWRAVDGKGAEKKSGPAAEEQLLPLLKVGDSVIGEKYEVLEKETKPPKRFTEKTLLAGMETAGKSVDDEELREAMKDHGIGTPATRASIIERLLQVDYIKREAKNLVPTEKGVGLISALPVAEIKSPGLTGEWEFKLRLVERGQLPPQTFLQEITEFTLRTAETLKQHHKQVLKSELKSEFTAMIGEALGTCPNCGQQVCENTRGFGCSSWKSGCKFQIWSPVAGKKLSAALVKQLLSTGQTSTIKGFKSKAGKSFAAGLELVKDGNGKLELKFVNEGKVRKGTESLE